MCTTKEKKPLNEREEEYNHIREDWRITWGKQEGVLCCHPVTQNTCPNLYYIW